jgi:CheY-like chemotaxis protein
MEAAARARRPYPLVLLDAAMPAMDGFDLAARIQQNPRLAGASVMMLSSGARPGDRARCFELGISAYLTKPVKQSDLMDTIVGVLAEPSGRVALPPPGPRPRPDGRRLRVLVAEDNVVNQQVAAGILERAGHLPTIAENGREVLALLEKGAFDVVLMDVQMPELDGLETAAAIRDRERSRGGHLPIVALTAHAMKGDAERCLAAGMDAYLAKPLHPRELDATLARVLDPRPAGSVEPAPPSTAQARDVVDVPRLLERVGGDRKALADLVHVFREDWSRQRARLADAVGAGDAQALRAAAHALKGAVSNFAAPAATEAALHLQKLGEAGTLAGAGAAVARFEGEVGVLLEALASVCGAPDASAGVPPRARSHRDRQAGGRRGAPRPRTSRRPR